MNEVTLTDANFEAEVLKSNLPVLVDFFAEWCGPCRMQAPIIEELAKETGGKIKIGKIDIDKNGSSAEKYQVMSIPTIVFFKDGKEANRLMGLQNKETLQTEINKII